MKTKTIPFDLETVKKIQAGEIKGWVMCNNVEAHIIDLDMYFQGKKYICAQVLGNTGEYITSLYNADGTDADFIVGYGLYIELQYPDDVPQFKPFDKVLVAQNGWGYWIPSLYRNKTPDGKHICIDNLEYDKCRPYEYNERLPYEGNEHLVGITNKPYGE